MIKRNKKVDELRGLLMILVVIGHIIQFVTYPETFDDNIVFRIIYSFHMPLFMLLSGYVSQIVHPHMNFCTGVSSVSLIPNAKSPFSLC